MNSLFELRKLYTPETIAQAQKPGVLAVIFLASLVFNLSRYFTWSAFLYWLLYKKKRAAWGARKLQATWPDRSQVLLELRWSITSCVVYSLLTVALFVAAIRGDTRIYLNFSDHGWGWFFGSIAVMLVLHDAYFYWTHRLSHEVRWVFRRVHLIHHKTTNPTPFADIMFHPVDALIHAGFVPLFLFTIPVHPLAFWIFMTIVTAVNAVGHTGFELFPDRWRTHWFWRHVSRAETHNAHHASVHGNYGLYFNFWDRVGRTVVKARGQSHRP